jgi:hypothetical protein
LKDGTIKLGFVEEDDGSSFFYLHGWFMWAAWGLLGLL